MKFKFMILFMLASVFTTFAQTFPTGTNAIQKDSSIIVSWAVSAVVERGYINIADTAFTYSEGGTTSNRAWKGNTESATGFADGTTVSLGDGGSITLQFEQGIADGEGPDFVVFENSIFSPPTQTVTAFIELAFVEVSSNGVDYVRFPAVSNFQITDQIGTFEAVEWNHFENFAGIYPVFYGVPFDIAELNSEMIDKNNITYIRLVDVVGNIDPEYGSTDSNGNIVNDAWPTPFATCGFDLDAVGVINVAQDIESFSPNNFKVYPNPCKELLVIDSEVFAEFQILDSYGKIIKSEQIFGNKTINLNGLKNGIYFLRVNDGSNIFNQKIIKLD